MLSLSFAFISMLAIMGNSLAASKLFSNKEKLNACTATILSLSPAFIISAIIVPFMNYKLKSNELGLMFLKNSMYGIAFFLRLEGFKKLGPFAGAILLTAQPILVSLFGWILLKESLKITELLALCLTVIGLFIVNKSKKDKKVYSRKHIAQFLALPAILLSLTMIADRHLLIGQITGVQFFFVDKLTLFPAFFLAIIFFKSFGIKSAKIELNTATKNQIIKYLFILGGFWTVSSLFYGMALEQEKTIWIAIIRSLAFPLVAVISSFDNKGNINKKSITGLALVTCGCLICTIS